MGRERVGRERVVAVIVNMCMCAYTSVYKHVVLTSMMSISLSFKPSCCRNCFYKYGEKRKVLLKIVQCHVYYYVQSYFKYQAKFKSIF